MINLLQQKVFAGVFSAIVSIFFIYQFFYLSLDTKYLVPFHTSTLKAKPLSLYCYGDRECFPALQRSLESDVEHAREMCRNTSTPWQLTNQSPRMATVTAQFGEIMPHYEQALRTQAIMSQLHGADVHVLRTVLVDRLWNKPAHILSVLLAEMTKPEEERAEWMLWLDYDTVILDKCRSPASFLPPPALQGQIHLIAARDRNGLNNGIFLIRVSMWSINLLNDILAFRHYNPGVRLKYTEQTAMELVLEQPDFKKNVTWVPQWFFNAFPGPNKTFKSGEKVKLKEFQARRGDFLVHFAGTKQRDVIMVPWLQFSLTPEGELFWQNGARERDMDAEIRRFWEKNLDMGSDI